MKNKRPAVYILANRRNGSLYTGVTSDLLKRIWLHKSKLVEGFAKKYAIDRLVYFEFHEDIVSAITREKNIKKWKRAWKIKLIEENNKVWRDLYDEIVG